MDSMLEGLKESLKNMSTDEQINTIQNLTSEINNLSPLNKQPVSSVKWVKIDEVIANSYNPNKVAKTEMRLLYISIKHDGYTQPIVTIYDDEKKKYVIVDGFHRYFVCKTNKKILERNHGYVPIVILDKGINDRMASTIRHNRARGKHSVDGMSNLVFKMLRNGWEDTDICNELGMEAEELIKLKHITGFSKLFQDTKYKKSWEKARQIKFRKEYERAT